MAETDALVGDLNAMEGTNAKVALPDRQHPSATSSPRATFTPHFQNKGPLWRTMVSKFEWSKQTQYLGDLKVNSQVFGMADTIDVPLLDEVVWDGIIGLAYPNQKLNDQGVTPLVDNMMKKKNKHEILPA